MMFRKEIYLYERYLDIDQLIRKLKWRLWMLKCHHLICTGRFSTCTQYVQYSHER
jgi:hypothetical protein